MKGDTAVLRELHQVLKGELTAINQYFLHSRILKDQGFEKLADLEYKSSIDEMRHADEIIQRILFLESHPNLQILGKLRIGQNIEEILQADLELEYDAVERLKAAITVSESKEDYISRDLFQKILISEEGHVDWLETQLHLLKEIGVQNYGQTQVMMDQTHGAHSH